MKTRISVLVENEDLKLIEALVKERKYSSRSHFINKAILEELRKHYPKKVY